MRFDDRSESLDLVKVRRFLQIRVEFVYGIEGIEISLRVMKESLFLTCREDRIVGFFGPSPMLGR